MKVGKVLYIRSKYSLNLKAGGSVAHTEGVILSLNKQSQLDVYSNDHLNNILPTIKIIKPILKKVPIFNELLYNFKVIRRLWTVKDYDFIYQRYSGESFNGAFLASKNKIPFILEFNSFDTWKIQNWPEKGSWLKLLIKKDLRLKIVRKIENYNLKKASIIVVVSDVLKDSLMQIGVPEKKILVNPNGVNVEKFVDVSDSEIQELRTKLNLKDKIIFGFIGTFGQWHGVLELAKSIVKFYDKYGDSKNKIRFLLIGDGFLMPEVKNILNNSNWNDKVILTGAIPQTQGPVHLKSCDYLLSPHVPNPDGTKFFGSPTKLFEYLACKKPVIASDLDQIGDILTHNSDAILTEPGDVNSLVEAMNKVLKDESLCQKISDGAFHLVKEKYTWDIHVKNIIEKYQQEIAQ